MKALDQPHTYNTSTTAEMQTFEVEASDVGIGYPHQRGFNHTTRMIRGSDVGRQIHRYTDPKSTFWTCWNFVSGGL